MKRFLISLLLAFMLIPVVTQAQTHYVVQVGSGTSTNPNVPAYTYWGYSYAQMIYTASEVGIDGEIDTLSFQVDNTTTTRLLAIYMAEVSATSFSGSGAVPASNFHLVYTGNVTFSAGWVNIPLDSTFNYNDTGSLVIAVLDNTGSYDYPYTYFTGTVASNNRTLYDYNDDDPYTLSSPLSDAGNFLPNIRLGINSYSLYCAQPSDVAVSGIHDDQATISWHENGAATAWDVIVSDSAITDFSSASVVSVYDTSYTVYGLDANTNYYVYVRASCSSSDFSGWTNAATFTSACSGQTTLPYTTGFEGISTGQLPNCWQQLLSGSSGAGSFPAVYEYASNARNGNVYFEFESSAGATELAAMPTMDDISMLQFTFYASLMNHNFVLEVGVMEDTSFVPVDTIDLITGSGNNWHGSYNRYQVFFNNYSGTGDRIAMRVTSGGSYTLMMDDFEVDYAPNCLPVSHLAASYVGSDTVILNWQAGGNESSWLVSDGTNSFEVYDTTYTFENLNPSTQYTFSVYALCGDTSEVRTLSLRTACGALTSLPFSEDFSSYASSSYPDCWTRILNANNYPYVTTSYGQAMMFGGLAAAISPRMPVPVNQMVVSFDLRREGSSSGDMQFGYTLDPNSVDSMVVLETISISTYSTYFHYEFSFPNDTCTQPVYLVWRPTGTSNWYHWLDNVLVEGVSSCAKPLNFHCTANATGDSVAFEWSDTSNATAWQLFIGTHGTNPNDDSLIFVFDSSYVFTDLQMGTSYDVYLRTDCGDTVSTWVSVMSVVPGSFNLPETGTYSITGCGYTIYDNGGPSGDYSTNNNSTLTIYPSSVDSVIRIWGTCTAESGYDHLYIYDGPDANSPLFLQIENGTIDTLTSTTGPITIRFTSDGSTQYSGFELFTDCVGAPNCNSVTDITILPGVTSALISWTPGVLGTYNGADVSYKATSDTGWTYAFTTAETYGAISGLTPLTEYQVRVIASCDEGTAAEETATFTTTNYGCAVIDSTNSVSDTIGNGTSQNSYLPSYSFYDYSLSQQIYTSSELGSGGAITAISVMPAAITSQRVYEIYMAHTSQSSLSGFIHPSDMVRVYDGAPVTLTPNQWITFQLDSPFSYNGSENLLVCFRDMTGSYASGNYWYTHTNPNGNSVYLYRDNTAYDPYSTTGGTTTSSRDNMIFDFLACAQVSTCPAPVASVVETQPYSVTVAWAPGDVETSWNLSYRRVGDSAFTSAGSTSTLTYTFTGLSASTEYEFRIQSPCAGSNDGTAIVSAYTECGPAPLPFTEDFESMSGTFSRNCWYTGSTNLGSTYPYPTVVNLTGDPNHLLLLYNGAYIILPEMDAPLNQLQIRFNFVQGGDNVRLIMGIMDNPTAPISTIRPIDTLIRSNIDTTSAYVYITYPLSHLTDTTGHLAFWDAFNDNYSFLDNIVIEYIPNCTSVTELSVGNVTGSSADLSWTGSTSAISYIVEYGARGFVPGSGNGTIVNTTSPYITISGLEAGTSYEAYVYSVCNNDTSIASQVVRFTTECGTLTTLPYVINFENIVDPGDASTNIVPNCWAAKVLPAGAGNEQPHVFYNTDLGHAPSPQYCLYFDGVGIAALPEMATPIDSLMISFHLWNDNPANYGLIIGAVDNIDTNFETTFVPIDTIPFIGTGNQYDVVSILNNYTGTANRIAIATYNADGGSYADQYIDNLVVDRIPSCIAPMRVQVTALTNVSADLAWVFSNAPNYSIEYGVHGFTPGTGTTVTSTTNSVSLTGLTPLTQYDVYLVSLCSATESSDTTLFTFTTRRAAPVTSYPYYCDFSDSTMAMAWEPVNGAQTNKWYVGSDTYYGSSDNMSLYISNDNGVSNSYTNSSLSFVYAYRTFTMNAGSYNVGFNWKANGESNYDYIRAWLAPADFVFTPGQTPDGGTSSYSYTSSNPSGWISLDGGSKLNLQSTWQTANVDVTIPAAGDYNLVFMWANDGSSGSNPPGAIDNVEVAPNTCRVTNVRQDPSMATSDNQLFIMWDTCGADYYQVAYGTPGFTPTTGFITSFTNTATIIGLTGLSNYEVCVRGICNGGLDTGRWERAAFQTDICDAPGIVYSYDSTMSATTSSYGPMGYSFYNYGYVQTLIDSAQMAGLTDPIIAFAFNPSTGNQGNYYTHMTIYMANVPEADLSAGYIMPDSNHVFVPVVTDRDLCYTDAGWHLHGFDTAFTWDGHSNVLFAVVRGHGSYSSGANFNAHSTSTVHTRYSYQDGSPYSPTNPSGGNTGTGNYVGDLQFISCGASGCGRPVITGTSITYHSATITWNGNGNDYEVNIKESAAPDWPATDVAVSGTTHTFTGLRPSTAYTYRVRQNCNADSLGYSDWVINGFITDSLPCLTPDSLHATAVTNATADLDWNVNGNETNWDIHVWYSGGFDSTYRVSSRPATVGGFTAGVTYYAAIRALCGVNLVEGDWSDTVSFTTAVCPDVTGLSAGYATANSITLSWDNNPMAQSWIIEYGFSGFPQGSGITTTSATNNYVVNGLTDETLYDFHVRAVCGSEWYSEGWASVSASTLSGGVTCDAPTNVTATVADNSVTVNWTAGQGNLSFELEYGPHGFAHGSGIVVTAATSPIVISNLDYETQYDVYVHAICDQNTVSPWSTPATFTTGQRPSEDCNPVQNLAVSNITDNSADVNWTPGDPDDSNWQIVVTDERGNDVLDTRSTETRAALSGLTPGTNYTVKVRTVCDEDNFSAFVSANFRTTGGIGIDDVSSASCSIYPNPASGSTTISVAGVNGLVKIAVVDMNGRTVASETLECNSDCVKTMDVDKLAQGAYFVRITGQDINMVRKLIIR